MLTIIAPGPLDGKVAAIADRSVPLHGTDLKDWCPVKDCPANVYLYVAHDLLMHKLFGSDVVGVLKEVIDRKPARSFTDSYISKLFSQSSSIDKVLSMGGRGIL